MKEGYKKFVFRSKLILLVIQEVMQNFKIVALLLLGYFWLVMKKIKIKELLIIIATLATTEVSAGALAKADQNETHFQKTSGN